MRYFEGSPIKELLNLVIKEFRIEQKLEEQKVIDAWNKILGDYVSKYTQQIYVKEKKLFVTISSSVLKQELFMGRNKILSSINEVLGKNCVEEIIFR